MSTLFPQDFLEELGIADWGYTEEAQPRSFDRFDQWVERDQQGPLKYLADERRLMRADLRKVWAPFQSALVFFFHYREAKKAILEENQHRIAGYALGFDGEDYHRALRRRLLRIQEKIKENYPQAEFLISLDALPILERDLAYRAGLGWFGKNSMMISQKEGSYFLIGTLLLDHRLPLETGETVADFCGTCTACADACPTNAIDVDSRTIRASDCISTFTIETLRDAPAPLGYDRSRGELFGCDICQDVCPWNRKPLDRTTARISFERRPMVEPFVRLSREELQQHIANMSVRGFDTLMDRTALLRPGRRGWLKNFK